MFQWSNIVESLHGQKCGIDENGSEWPQPCALSQIFQNARSSGESLDDAFVDHARMTG